MLESVRTSFTRNLSPTSTLWLCSNNPSTRGPNTRTNVPRGVTPVTIASNVCPIFLLMATAANLFDISRSTLRAASSFTVQLLAIAASSSSE